MRWVLGWAALGWLCVASPARAGEGEPPAADQLPPEVATRIRDAFGVEPVHARKEVEGGRVCYTVTAVNQGRVVEIYASPDGSALVRKTEAFSLARWAGQLPGIATFLLLPGVVAGAVARGSVRAVLGRSLSVPVGWCSAWAGAGVGIGLIVFNLATVPREKDVVVLGAYCVLYGATAASGVEVVALNVGPGRGDRAVRRRSVVGCCVVAGVSLGLTIPLDILRVERENRYLKQLTLRPVGP